MQETYDFVVIGAGSGGVRAARTAAGLGAKVAIVESRYLGGTCVNVGCVPKKMLVYGSQFSEQFSSAKGFGWGLGGPTFDWPELIRKKDAQIERLNGIYQNLLENSGVTLYRGHGRLLDTTTVSVTNIDPNGSTKETAQLKGKYILLAPGGWPRQPSVPGAEHCITSNEIFYLEQLPKRALIVGGGYIAIEFAGILNGLGVDTRLIYRGEQLIRGFDEDLRTELTAAMQARGVQITTQEDLKSIVKKSDSTLTVELKSGEILETDLVLAAIGRVPNLEGLGLDAADVVLNERGFIQVDDYFKTNQESIFALGDVIGRVALTPVAIREAMVLVRNLFGDGANNTDQWITPDYQNIPTALFSQPELGTVGLTEDEAKKTHGEIEVYRSKFRPLKHSITGKEEKTFMKLIVAKESQRVVGLHMIGDDVGEMLQGFSVAIKMGATKADFDATTGIHPTAAEELVTMR